VDRLIAADAAMQLITIHRIPLIVLTLTALPITALGQINDNLQSRSVRIVGRVIDPANAGIPNTRVTLKLSETDKTVAEVRSDQDGRFYFPSVAVQGYEIWFQASGFDAHTVQAKGAGQGGDYDVGVVKLWLTFAGDTVDISKPPSTPASPIHTTLCELVREADHFHGEFVELRAAVYPDGAGVTRRLTDSSCGANVGLHFPEEPSAATVKDLPLLRRYVEQHLVVMATVSGKFALVPVYHDNPMYTLNLEAASDLVVAQPGVSISPKTR